MYNYAILADCRKECQKMDIYSGKMHKKIRGILDGFWK